MTADESYQRVQIRLRRDQLDESRVLSDYNERSKLLGRADHDYLRYLLLVGHLFVSRISTDNIREGVEGVALSTNESNNTEKERVKPSLTNESKTGSEIPTQDARPKADEVVGSAIRQLAGVFGGNKAS